MRVSGKDASTDQDVPQEDRLAYSIPELAKGLGISASTLWKHIGTGKIHAVRIGGRTVVTHAERRRLLKQGTR